MSILTLKSTIPVVLSVLELYKNKKPCSTLFVTDEYEITVDYDEYSSRVSIHTMQNDRRNDIISVQIDNNYTLKYDSRFAYHVLFGQGYTRNKMYVTTHTDDDSPKNIEFRNFTNVNTDWIELPRYMEDEQYFMNSTVHNLPVLTQFQSYDSIVDVITSNIDSVSAKISYLDMDVSEDTYNKWLNIIWGLVNVTKQC